MKKDSVPITRGRIDVPTIRAAYADAVATARTAVEKAIYVGVLLNEASDSIAHGTFEEWVAEQLPEISLRTAQRWMQAARRAIESSGVTALLPAEVPVSALLVTSEPEQLPDEAREAHQLLFGFLQDKTINDCLHSVVLDGEEPHRISRVAGGMQHGGHKGEDRKAFEEFIGRDLRNICGHLAHKLSPTQQAAIVGAFDRATVRFPRWLCEGLADALKRELKLTDVERAARKL